MKKTWVIFYTGRTGGQVGVCAGARPDVPRTTTPLPEHLAGWPTRRAAFNWLAARAEHGYCVHRYAVRRVAVADLAPGRFLPVSPVRALSCA